MGWAVTSRRRSRGVACRRCALWAAFVLLGLGACATTARPLHDDNPPGTWGTNVTSDKQKRPMSSSLKRFFPASAGGGGFLGWRDSPFGLGGSVYTSDVEHGKRVASRLDTGMVFVNYPFISAPDLPFGGIKRSGYGKELSSLGIRGS